MDAGQAENRRRAYRYEPPPVLEPLVNVLHQGRRNQVVRVIDINMRGARFALDNVSSAHLTPGLEITVSIQAPGLDGVVNVPARIVFNANQNEQTVLAVVFEMVPDVDDRVDGHFFNIFNRRQEQRRDQVNAVSAVILASGNSAADSTGFEVEVVNHSTHGIGFVVNSSVDQWIRGRDALNLAIQVGDTETSRQLTAKVLHRATRDDHVYYGCVFAG